ncbi:hypothetical protein HK097_009566 [Rhizophlyctis rosea]|uniref:Sulfotransferase n=1 Tax=Rhizophlyctis rosea TaxID=64517 RepID=A0AAD5S8T5_9FUNG|nr:hypothetical protein HK097_009566 [Rhizophlyctis rosea]
MLNSVVSSYPFLTFFTPLKQANLQPKQTPPLKPISFTEPLPLSPHILGYTRFSTPIKILNYLGTLFLSISYILLPIPVISLLALFKTLTPTPIVNETEDAYEGFSLLLNEFAKRTKELGLTTYCRLWFRVTVPMHLRARECVARYLGERPEIENVDLGRPIVVTGLHRTGSTLLHRLLSLDPHSRTITPIDSWGGIPDPNIMPPHKSRHDQLTSSRAKSWYRTHQEWKQTAPEHFYASQRNHRFEPDIAEEELLFFSLHGKFSLLSVLLPPPAPGVRGGRGPAPHQPGDARAHRCGHARAPGGGATGTCIQAMHQVWAPKSHWVLKAPEHALYPEVLWDHYPGARIVVTERDVVESVLSTCRLYADDLRAYTTSLNLHSIGQAVLHQSLLKIENLTRFRTHLTLSNPHLATQTFFDVNFKSFIKSPISTIRSIYNHYGLEWSEEFEEAMERYLEEDKVRRRREARNGGAPEGFELEPLLGLERFGLTEEFVRGEVRKAEERGRMAVGEGVVKSVVQRERWVLVKEE